MNNRNFRFSALAASALLLMAPFAMAQEAPPPEAAADAGQQQATSWEALDTDKNGTINKQEATQNPHLTQIFDAADADKDGELTQDEYRAHAANSTPTPPAQTDEN